MRILLIEPISRNINMYVPAYPLPLLEIASYVKQQVPNLDISIISVPMDYGIPLTRSGKDAVYLRLLQDLEQLNPAAVGISCTAISQAEEALELSSRVKQRFPSTYLFMGGYFPTLYYKEIFSRSRAVDLVVRGEGEIPALQIVEALIQGRNPASAAIENLVWMENDGLRLSTPQGKRFDLRHKAPLDLDLLQDPSAYDVIPYAFSRGCPFQCNFCMEDYIRPHRKTVPEAIIRQDLTRLKTTCESDILLVSDALFRSFDRFPLIRSLGLKVHFETRCDVLDPVQLPRIADACGMLALGFESASFDTLKRMNKVRDRAHYDRYITNTAALFKAAVRHEIPVTVFMIAGYPGDTEADLAETFRFAKELSKTRGPGGHIFKIGECRVYPGTKIMSLARSLPGVQFDDDGVFGENIVRRPSKDLNFETVLAYMRDIFNLSNATPKLQRTLLDMMPFFRLPGEALRDRAVPDACYRDSGREILDVGGSSLALFREQVPGLTAKFKASMSDQRKRRELPL